MVARHHQIDFATGALVFPGGAVDQADSDPRLRRLATLADRLDDAALALRVAGIRESFEECGVLLARPRGSSELVSGKRLLDLAPRYREPLEQGQVTMADMAEAEGLELALDLMVPFAHWITPPHMPKRFDTFFLLAPAPVDQVAEHDGRESVDSVWIRPEDAIADAEAERRTVIFPTRMNLMKLARSATVGEALARARSQPVVPVLPTVERVPGGRIMRIPAEAGYGASEIHLTEIAGPGNRVKIVRMVGPG